MEFSILWIVVPVAIAVGLLNVMFSGGGGGGGGSGYEDRGGGEGGCGDGGE
jgi:hypothetical protein